MSKFIQIIGKKPTPTKLASSTDSSEFIDVDNYLCFINVALLGHGYTLIGDGEKSAEFLYRFVIDVVIPLVSANIGCGWNTLDCLLNTPSWIKFWKKEIAIEMLSGNKDFLKYDFANTKLRALCVAWNQSNNSATESDKLIDWISIFFLLAYL